MDTFSPLFKMIAGALAVADIGALGMLLFLKMQTPESFTGSLDRSLNAEIVENFRSAYDIETIEKRLEAAASLDEEAQLKRALAIEYLQLRNFNKMYELLREVADDTRYSSFERAFTVQTMSDLFFERTTNAPQLAEDHIFVDEPYKSMLDASINNQSSRVSNAMKKLSEYALSLEPTPVSEFRLARWYIENADLKQAKLHIESGTSLLPSYLEKLPNGVAPTRAKAYWLRGLALGEYGIASSDPTALSESKSSFEQARALLQQNDASALPNHAMSAELQWADFYYAALLARMNDPKDTEHIARVLQEIVESARIRASFTWHIIRILDNAELVEPHVSQETLRDLMRREPLFDSYVNRLKPEE